MLANTNTFTELDRFALGPFIIEPSSGLILLGDEERQVQPKVMQLLLCLVANHGQIVSREFLLEHVWPGVFVDGGALRRGIYFLRKSLTTAGDAQAIETLSKRGYRLNLIPSELREDASEAPAAVVESVKPTIDSAYRGLQVFDVDHADRFFGRSTLIAQACDAMSQQLADGRGFLLLLGASGSGKSSLARAGVIPSLVERASVDASAPEVIVFEAGKGARDPLHHLVLELLRVFSATRPLDADVHAFIQALAEDTEQAVADLVEAHEGDESQRCRIVVLFDQFEQLLSPATLSEDQRQQIFSVIYSLARSGVVQIVATMRNEFYPQLTQHETLRFLKGRFGVVDVTQPGAAEIADIVRRPAELAGLTFEQRPDKKRLDVLLIDEATEHSNSLPLLQFALRELELASSDDNELRFADYEQLGSLKGCLSSHAERVFLSLTAAEQATLPQVLSQLVTADPRNAGRLLKRSVPLNEFKSAEARSLVQHFVDARLMISFLDPYTDEPSIEVIHESVLQYWQRARDWAEGSYADLRFRSWMTELSDKWQNDAESEAYLLRDGKLLVDAEKLMQRVGFFDDNQRRFVEASLKRANRAGNVRRGAVALLVALLAVASGMGYLATQSADRAEQALARATETSAFMESMFLDADPGATGKDLTAVELLETARRRLEQEPLRDPLAQADALRSLGEYFRRLNEYSQAESMYEAAAEALGSQRDSSPRLAAQVSLELAGMRREQHEYEAAREYGLEALDSARQAGDAFLAGRSQNMLGLIAWNAKSYDDATNWYAQAAATLEPIVDQSEKNLRLLSRLYNNMGLNQTSRGDYDAGAVAYRKAKALLISRGLENSADYSQTMNNFAMMLRYQGAHAESAEIFQDVIASRLKYQPIGHPEIVSLHANLASAQMSMKDYAGVLNTVSAVLGADLTHEGYTKTAIPQLQVRRVSAQQLGGLPSSLQDIQEAREGIQVLRREFSQNSSMPLESEMAVGLAVWERGALSGQSLSDHCAQTRRMVAEQAERQFKNPRLIEFDGRLQAFLINCAGG